VVRDLVFDIGMHDGRDTSYYLARGFRVVAVEANPELVTAAVGRFQEEIDMGRLVIVNRGIGPTAGRAKFWVNDDQSEHSSFDPVIGARNDSRAHVVEVDCIRFESLLNEFGTPYYLKIDIETSDIHCLEALSPDDLPPFLSVEAHALKYLAMLSGLGYERFKVIDQLTHEAVTPDTPVAVEPAPVPRSVVRDGLGSLRRAVGRVPGLRPFYRRLRPLPIVAPQADAAVAVKAEPVSGPSGPFGDNTPGDWLTLDQAAYAWLRTRFEQPARSWYDFHARL
jgi:FkbM family methyltransferase